VNDHPIIIEAAINGATSKRANPNVPLAPDDIARDALACMDAGAAIVHNHIDRFGLAAEEAAERYLEGWRPVLAQRPDALLYPTINTGPSVEASFWHIEQLVDAVGLRIGLCDAGSVNFGSLDEQGIPQGGYVYRNSHDDARYQMELCRRLGLGPSMAIFEPGFLRAIAAWSTAGALPPGGMIKLYFGGTSGYLGGTGMGVPFGLPPTRRALDAYLELLDAIDVPWSAAVLGGDLCTDADFVDAVLEAGGHLHVGLEDCNIVGTRTNVELVETAAALVEKSGRRVATRDEAVAILGLPTR
jgi:uncharacterized protein (DUF849 family)